jgi:hypothetical protein
MLLSHNTLWPCNPILLIAEIDDEIVHDWRLETKLPMLWSLSAQRHKIDTGSYGEFELRS